VKPAANGFGERLRWRRERRGLSQLDLAGVAETSQRPSSPRSTLRSTTC
jgi:transcriptional regulator with XRE-family HTH domain